MKEFKTIVIANRTNTIALKKDAFAVTAVDYNNWKEDVEALRLAVSDWAVADRNMETAEAVQTALDKVYNTYRKVLSYFKTVDDKLKAEKDGSDIRSIRDFAGAFRKQAGSTTGKDFLPVGAPTFRKSVEDFISDRLTSRKAETAETIEARKRAKAEKKKAEKKAKREAEKKAQQKVA